MGTAGRIVAFRRLAVHRSSSDALWRGTPSPRVQRAYPSDFGAYAGAGHDLQCRTRFTNTANDAVGHCGGLCDPRGPPGGWFRNHKPRKVGNGGETYSVGGESQQRKCESGHRFVDLDRARFCWPPALACSHFVGWRQHFDMFCDGADGIARRDRWLDCWLARNVDGSHRNLESTFICNSAAIYFGSCRRCNSPLLFLAFHARPV